MKFLRMLRASALVAVMLFLVVVAQGSEYATVDSSFNKSTKEPSETPILTQQPVTIEAVELTGEPCEESELPVIEEMVYYDVNIPDEYQELIAEAVIDFDINLDNKYIYALIYVESSYNHNTTSSAGAKGWMQLMPGTFKHLYPKLISEYPKYKDIKKDIWNKRTNIIMGLYELHRIADNAGYSGVDLDNIHQVLTCYNRGEAGGRKHKRKTGSWESGYSKKVLKKAENISIR